MKKFLYFLLLNASCVSLGHTVSCPDPATVIEAIKKDHTNFYSTWGVLTVAGYPWRFKYLTQSQHNDFWQIFQETQSDHNCQLSFAGVNPCRYVIGRNGKCMKPWAILALTYEG